MAAPPRRAARSALESVLRVVAQPSLRLAALLSIVLVGLAVYHWPGARKVAATAPASRSTASGGSVWASAHGSAPPQQYLISSIIYFGRISNIKISLIELLGAAVETRRRLVMPELSECAVDGYDRTFGGLFDTTLPLTADVLSTGSFDFHTVCNGSAVYVDVGPFPMENSARAPNGRAQFRGLEMDAISAQDLPLATGGGARGGAAAQQRFVSVSDQVAGPVHTRYYSAGQTSEVSNYQRDPLLLEKLAQRKETCVVLGKHFHALNWERYPETFVRAVRNLAPAPHIRASALAFLARFGLGGGGCPRGVPAAADDMRPEDLTAVLGGGKEGGGGFSGWGSGGVGGGKGGARPGEAGAGGGHFLGLHLRMGDFLTDERHRSFGAQCNSNPTLLIDAVAAALKRAPHLSRVVVATDDFASPCYVALAAHFGEEPVHAATAARAAAADEAYAEHKRGADAVAAQHAAGRPGGLLIPVHGGSPYRSSTCSAALFDQEVLGMAGAFLGDRLSSFSEAVHRIRTLRCGAPVASTQWLGA